MCIKGHFEKCFSKNVLGQNKKFGGFGRKIGGKRKISNIYCIFSTLFVLQLGV
jgi:hypothetical protein